MNRACQRAHSGSSLTQPGTGAGGPGLRPATEARSKKIAILNFFDYVVFRARANLNSEST